MLGRASGPFCLETTSLLGALAALFVTACSSSRPVASAPRNTPQNPTPAALNAVLETPVRLFHTAIDEAFWISHSDEVDRVVVSGSRLEVSAKTGEILDAAWDIELAQRSDPLQGSLAVAQHLGGGFIHWSRNQLFRSETFTGPLRPIHVAQSLGNESIRGARNGLDSVLVFSEVSAASVVGTNDTTSPPPFAGLTDFAALDAKRAVRINVVGNVSTTIDGGKTWIDGSDVLGISVKSLAVEPDAISVNTTRGQYPWKADGTFGPLDIASMGARRGYNYTTILRRSRVEDTSAWWTWRDTPPVQAAILAGLRVNPATAVAIAPTALAEVDLATAQITRAISDWPQAGLSCSTFAVGTEQLFVCAWDPFQGYGAYVLRAVDGHWPPTIERVFSDDSFFVASDDGALGFVGSCTFTPKYLDPNDTSRMEFGNEQRVGTKICVRRSAGEWIEHEIEVDRDESVQGWAASPDGSAVAIVSKNEGAPLPDRLKDPLRVSMQGAVRVVRIAREIDGFVLARPTWNPYGGTGRAPAGPLVDRRLQLRDDGSIEAWLSIQNNSDSSAGMHAGAVIDRNGNVTVYPPPARVVSMIATGDQGLALLDDGQLAETIDHGRSYRAAGSSPVPVGSFGGYCSALGCTIGPTARLGWGLPVTNPKVHVSKIELPQAPPPVLQLDCSPTAAPDVIDDKFLHKGSRSSWPTGYGDALSLVREVENVPDMPPDPDFAPQDATSRKPDKPARAPTRTQSLLFRPPFDPAAVAKRLDATGLELESARRGGMIPLLGKDGDMSLLIISDKQEVLVAGETISTLPLFEARRYFSADTNYAAGLLIAPDKPIVFGEVRRRVALEEHGPGTPKAPVYVGYERDSSARRPIGLARRDDGAMGLVLWDGSPVSVAAIGEFDQSSRTFRALTPLASWTTATMADDPRCKNKQGWQMILPIDPSAWFDVKSISGIGIRLGTAGNMLVRWTKERLCIEAIDAALTTRVGYEWRYDNHLVVRWQATRTQQVGAAALTDGVRRRLDCRLRTKAEAVRP